LDTKECVRVFLVDGQDFHAVEEFVGIVFVIHFGLEDTAGLRIDDIVEALVFPLEGKQLAFQALVIHRLGILDFTEVAGPALGDHFFGGEHLDKPVENHHFGGEGLGANHGEGVVLLVEAVIHLHIGGIDIAVAPEHFDAAGPAPPDFDAAGLVGGTGGRSHQVHRLDLAGSLHGGSPGGLGIDGGGSRVVIEEPEAQHDHKRGGQSQGGFAPGENEGLMDFQGERGQAGEQLAAQPVMILMELLIIALEVFM